MGSSGKRVPYFSSLAKPDRYLGAFFLGLPTSWEVETLPPVQRTLFCLYLGANFGVFSACMDIYEARRVEYYNLLPHVEQYGQE